MVLITLAIPRLLAAPARTPLQPGTPSGKPRSGHARNFLRYHSKGSGTNLQCVISSRTAPSKDHDEIHWTFQTQYFLFGVDLLERDFSFPVQQSQYSLQI